MIYICYHHTELTQITAIKEQKKVKNTKFDNNSHHEADVKRPQMTSKQLKQNQIRKTKIF